MGHEVAPALARKFGEPGGLFDTVLQRLVSEWHRFQVDLDPERLATLGAILEAGLSQLRSLELLLRTDDQPEAELELDLDLSRRTDQDVRSVYAADPRAGPEPSPRDRPGELGTLSPSRLDEAMHLLESLQDALQDVLSLGETPPLASSSPEPTHLETRRHRDLPRPHERRSRPDTHRAGEPPAPDLTIESPEPPARSRRPAVARPEPPVGDAQPVAESGDGQSGRPIDEIFPREAFDVASAAELKRCRRFERSFSLLLLDAGVEVDRRAGRILLPTRVRPRGPLWARPLRRRPPRDVGRGSAGDRSAPGRPSCAEGCLVGPWPPRVRHVSERRKHSDDRCAVGPHPAQRRRPLLTVPISRRPLAALPPTEPRREPHPPL